STESADGSSDPEDGADKSHDGNGPEEYLHHGVAAVDLGRVDFRLRGDRLGDFVIVLPHVKELQCLTDAVHDVGVPQGGGEIDDVIVESLQIGGVDLLRDIRRESLDQHGAALLADVQPFEDEEAET